MREPPIHMMVTIPSPSPLDDSRADDVEAVAKDYPQIKRLV
eukprot:COSAG06_NODE_55334_length_290_cov_0.722513_2_plen_40_part_01